MNCRAWETKHQNGSRYIHVVDASLEPEYVKDIAEHVAKSPLEGPTAILRDVAGSYPISDKGNESIGFGTFVPLDTHVLDDVKLVKENLPKIIQHQQVIAEVLTLIVEKLKLRE